MPACSTCAKAAHAVLMRVSVCRAGMRIPDKGTKKPELEKLLAESFHHSSPTGRRLAEKRRQAVAKLSSAERGVGSLRPEFVDSLPSVTALHRENAEKVRAHFHVDWPMRTALRSYTVSTPVVVGLPGHLTGGLRRIVSSQSCDSSWDYRKRWS